MAVLDDLTGYLINGNVDGVKTCTQTALNEGMETKKILNDGLLAGMEEVGTRFKNNEFFIPEVLLAARAMKAGMEILKPLLTETGVEPVGKVAMGTIKGDLHDIGKNLICMMLEGGGFEIFDLGVDVSSDQFIECIRNNGIQVIGMSTLLTTTMVNMKSTIEALKNANLRDSVKVIVGGAPVTRAYADEIGADGYSQDAANVVDVVKSLLNN